MDVSKRIEFIIENLDKVDTIADIGTDHGYVQTDPQQRRIRPDGPPYTVHLTCVNVCQKESSPLTHPLTRNFL
jgi:hypothetical protein